MAKTHDTLIDLHRATPAWYRLLAWMVPLGIFGQFLTAGLGVFLDPELLGLHGGIGAALSVPIAGLVGASVTIRHLRGFGWWAGAVLALYAMQIGLAAGGAPVPLSLHPANGALLLTASLVLLAKVERRVAG